MRLHNSPLADLRIAFFIYTIQGKSSIAVISVVFIYFACGLSAFWNIVKGSYQTVKRESKNIKFNLSKFATSKKNVLRGFHGDSKSWKLVSCVKGKVLNVVVDYRKDSKKYLKYSTFVLSDKNKLAILIPPGFLNSYLCLSKSCIYSYDYSFKGNYNDVKEQFSIKWNDKRINYKWPIKKPILSKRDK